jgi:hypothetical protein
MPHQEAQARRSLGCETFFPWRSASNVGAGCNPHDLWLPRRDRVGDLVWQAPRGAAVLAMRKPPASAGAFPSGRRRTRRRAAPQARPSSTRLPQAPGRRGLPDVAPPSIRWATSLQMQAMRKDQHAAYDRNKTRGSPRPGNALWPGLVSCGACGPKRVVQEKGGTRDRCHSRRPPYRTPGCQYMAAAPVDTRVGEAFGQALSPVALAVSAPALAHRQPQAARLATAHAQPRARRRSAAAYGERQGSHGAPAHRPVAAALEQAWAVALQALQQAEAAAQPRAQASRPPAHTLPPARPAAFRAMGQKLPERWPTDVRSQAPRQAFLRCLLDKGVSPRARRDQLHTRIVWRGGAPPTCEGPVAVGALPALPGAHAMAQQMRGLFAAGTRDDARARQLPQHGDRSPSRPAGLPSTVKGIRRKLGLRQHRSPAPPRRRAGSLPVPPRAKALGLTPPWGYHPIQRGTGVIQREAQPRRSLFPDGPATLAAFRPVRAGHRRARRD